MNKTKESDKKYAQMTLGMTKLQPKEEIKEAEEKPTKVKSNVQVIPSGGGRNAWRQKVVNAKYATVVYDAKAEGYKFAIMVDGFQVPGNFPSADQAKHYALNSLQIKKVDVKE